MSESGRAPRERTSLGFNTHGFEIRGRALELGGIVDAIPEADVVERARRHRLGRRHGRRVGASSRDSCAEGWVALDQPSLREKQRAETSFLRRRGFWRVPDPFVWVVARHWWRGRSGLGGNFHAIPTRLRFWRDKCLPAAGSGAATLPHAISALVASYTSIRRKCISNSSADLPRFAGRGRDFRLDFRVNFGNDFACNSLLFLLHHGRSYIYDLSTIFFPYRAVGPCSRPPVAAGAGPNRPESQDGRAPFRGLVRPPKAPPAARGRVNGQSERSGTGRMSDFVPVVRWDGAAPAELGGWDAVTSGSSNYPANVLLYTVTYLSSTSGSVVDSCVLLFLRSLLPCYSVVLCGTLPVARSSSCAHLSQLLSPPSPRAAPGVAPCV